MVNWIRSIRYLEASSDQVLKIGIGTIWGTKIPKEAGTSSRIFVRSPTPVFWILKAQKL